MNYLAKYIISFSGLKEGAHFFDFSVDSRFFSEFEGCEITKGSFAVQVRLEKRSTYLRLNFELDGEAELICDRCLEHYSQPIRGSFPILVKFSETETDDGDEVIYVHPGAHQIEVAQLIYEFIVISIPIRQVHPDGPNGKSLCDPEMLQKLNEYKATDFEESIPTDPRWDDLKNIIDK